MDCKPQQISVYRCGFLQLIDRVKVGGPSEEQARALRAAITSRGELSGRSWSRTALRVDERSQRGRRIHRLFERPQTKINDEARGALLWAISDIFAN